MGPLNKRKIGNSRRFLLILAFLSLDLNLENLDLTWNDVYTNDLYDLSSDYELRTGSILWLVDRFNGDCLGEF